MRPSVHDVPLDELIEMTLREPDRDDDIAECACCLAWLSLDSGCDPTSLCHHCAQVAAIRFAEALKEKRKMKTIDLVERRCPRCSSTDVTFSLEDGTFPYGEPSSPDRVELKCFAIVLTCNSCKEQVTDWQTEAIRDAAVKVHKEEPCAT